MQNGVGAQRPQIVTGAAQAPLTKNRRGGLDRWANAFPTIWSTAGSAIWDACRRGSRARPAILRLGVPVDSGEIPRCVATYLLRSPDFQLRW